MLSDAQEALHWFAQQPTVHWVSAQPNIKLHNWDASAICQSAEAPPDAPTAVADDAGSHPFWAAGLTGQGSVVGGGDSGVGDALFYSAAHARLVKLMRRGA